MNLVRISNLFNMLAQASGYFKSYHAGPHSDIQANVVNTDTGDQFPYVLWAFPPEGEINWANGGKDDVDIVLYFYGLQGYGNDNDPIDSTITTLMQWNKLKANAVEFVQAVAKVKGYSIKGQKAKWGCNYNLHSDHLMNVSMEFTLLTTYACADYESDPPLSTLLPSSVESVNDLENGQ